MVDVTSLPRRYLMRSATIVLSSRIAGRRFPIGGMYSFHSDGEYRCNGPHRDSYPSRLASGSCRRSSAVGGQDRRADHAHRGTDRCLWRFIPIVLFERAPYRATAPISLRGAAFFLFPQSPMNDAERVMPHSWSLQLRRLRAFHRHGPAR